MDSKSSFRENHKNRLIKKMGEGDTTAKQKQRA